MSSSVTESKPINQIELISAIWKHLDRVGVKHANSRQLNKIIEAANDIIAEFEQPERKVIPGMGVRNWLHTDHVGLSWRFMAAILSGIGAAEYNYPHDPSDFGRCLGLLEAAPELRELLPRMAATGPEWAALIGAWDELETLYREEFPTGEAPKCYARLRELIDGARKEHTAEITRGQS